MSKKKRITKTSLSTYYSLFAFILFLLAFSLRYQGVLQDTLFSLILVVVMFGVATLFLKFSKKKFSLVHLISLFVVYLASFVDKSAVLNDVVYGLAQPILFALFGYLLIKIFDIKLEYSFGKFKKLAIILGVSLLFAYLFLLLNEPFPSFVTGSFLLLLVYTFFVSLGEELVFRGVSFSLIKKVFSSETAVHLQAVLFTVIHLLSIGTLYLFYQIMGGSLIIKSPIVNVIVYAVALYGFAIIAARYAKGKKNTNIMYPIYFHWLVNFLNLLALMV